MSGKSTLLRAIGVNAVLAQAGAPVCARRLAMPPSSLATSMRLRDSLEIGVSFYMAELLRLKRIVDQARNAGPRNGRLLLYLLDEILMGTNSKERHIAVVRVMEHLLRHDTIGAISTHDLDLATSQPLSAACCCVHFRETLHNERAERIMTFDYRLRPGVATTSNALKLLELVGLGDMRRPLLEQTSPALRSLHAELARREDQRTQDGQPKADAKQDQHAGRRGWRGLQVNLPQRAAGRRQPAKHEDAEVVHHRHAAGKGVEAGEKTLEER